MALKTTGGALAIAFGLSLAGLAPAGAQAQVTGSIFGLPANPTPEATRPASHPLMTPEAIAQAQANFPNCIAGMWPLAQAKGVSQRGFQRFTTGLEPDMKIMDYLDSQPEFSRALGDYVNMLVSERRIAKGKEILAKYRPIFDAVEKAYKVDRYTVAAIWGIESDYGNPNGMGSRSVLRSTATLACIGRRQDYFRDEFIATLQILDKGDVPADHLKGSWAGAFGPTQFMPTSFQRFAVDFDGDGHRNVVDSIPDVIASTANNLKLDGWQFGKTWGRPGGHHFPRPSDTAFILLPTGAKGPAFLMLSNFNSILRYNPADAYALAIGHLSDRLRGGGPFVASWPAGERTLTRAERVEMQSLLLQRGYAIGNPDGILGSKTRVAVQDFQIKSGMVPD
ncbi:MAG: lytic transglycosylase, partial [Rhizobiales bacterium 12-66-7]